MNFHSLCDLDTHMNLFHAYQAIHRLQLPSSFMLAHACACMCVCVYVYLCMYVCACVPAVSQLPYYMHTQAAKQLHAFMWVYPGSGMVGLYLPIYLSTYPPSLLKHLLWVIYLLRLMM